MSLTLWFCPTNIIAFYARKIFFLPLQTILNIYFLGLWGLVNNASIWYISDIGMTCEKLFRKVMEVNLFGTVAVTQKFMPLLRMSKGRVVNMSSVAGQWKICHLIY